MTDLYIIAAGKGSRLGGNLPKALIPIRDGEPCLTNTINLVHHMFERIYVVTNVAMASVWEEYFQSIQTTEAAKNVYQIAIVSGLGDGHALLAALSATNGPDTADEVVVMWGDVFLESNEIMEELLQQQLGPTSEGLIPAITETNPYVTLLVDAQMNCIAADFAKYGERHEVGLHDQSVFRFVRSSLLYSLESLHRAFWKGGRYSSPSGELSTLYTFHELYNTGCPTRVYVTDYGTMSFNTQEEIDLIRAANERAAPIQALVGE